MADKKPTEIASLGEFGLIDHLTDSFSVRNASTLRGVGDDAAVIAAGADEVTLCTTDLLLEGVDFDLTYFPLKHLGYKAVVVAVSDLLAMNGRPEQLLVSLGVSSKISVEALDDLYAGIRFACEEMEVDLVGGDTKASVTGLAIHVTALGRARKEEVVYRGGAKLHDLICITGNLGAAYMGLQLLEREKRVVAGGERSRTRVQRKRISAATLPQACRPQGYRRAVGRGEDRPYVDDRPFGRFGERPASDL